MKLRFETIFAFMYSPRPQTKAAQFEDQVEELLNQSGSIDFLIVMMPWPFGLVARYENRTLQVLVEEHFSQKWEALWAQSRE
jgi:tRNA-2-methylthio-N6-dimethylallyladenosine synthase